MVLFHGGAFVAGNLDTDEHLCKSFAAKVPCVVVSVEYPLAPTSSIDQMIEAGVESVEWVRLTPFFLPSSYFLSSLHTWQEPQLPTKVLLTTRKKPPTPSLSSIPPTNARLQARLNASRFSADPDRVIFAGGSLEP